MATNGNDLQDKVESYRAAVLLYEELQNEINHLLRRHGGNSARMTSTDREQYRTLAQRRDEAMNEMRWLESLLLPGDDSV